MEKIDANDVIFIATALTVPNAIIWSDESELIKHRKRRKI